jgi:hypothetical protein
MSKKSVLVSNGGAIIGMQIVGDGTSVIQGQVKMTDKNTTNISNSTVGAVAVGRNATAAVAGNGTGEKRPSQVEYENAINSARKGLQPFPLESIGWA